jgi:hypothetical protein
MEWHEINYNEPYMSDKDYFGRFGDLLNDDEIDEIDEIFDRQRQAGEYEYIISTITHHPWMHYRMNSILLYRIESLAFRKKYKILIKFIKNVLIPKNDYEIMYKLYYNSYHLPRKIKKMIEPYVILYKILT